MTVSHLSGKGEKLAMAQPMPRTVTGASQEAGGVAGPYLGLITTPSSAPPAAGTLSGMKALPPGAPSTY